VIVRIHQGQLLDPVFLQDGLRFLERRPERCCDQVLRGHELGDGLVVIARKADVAVGENAHQSFPLRDGHAGDVVVGHDFLGLRQACGRRQGDRVYDHPGLGTLDLVHLRRLQRDRAVAVDDAQSPFACQRDRHACFRHGVHSRGKGRRLQTYTGRQLRRYVDGGGEHCRALGHQQHIVERQGTDPIEIDAGHSPSLCSE